MKKIVFSIFCIFNLISGFTQNNLIPINASWKYLDDGSDASSAWRNISFNDVSWQSGNAELGYGDGDEATTVSYGTSANDVNMTTYFRYSFNVVNPNIYSYLSMELLRDDGAVVYLNGTEIWRSNMPGGTINYLTPADGTIAWPNEDDWYTQNVGASLLVTGTNVIAVEIHQDDNTSSDISFNFKMDAYTTPLNASVTRGPYLQSATENSVIVKWRTDIATDSRIEFGTVNNNLNLQAVNPIFTTEHEVLITGLTTDTKYFYNIGSSGQVQLSNSNYYFKTHPPFGVEGKYRFWVIGDAGMGNNDQRSVRDAFLDFNQGEHINGWIMLGDNAYESGFDSEYQTGVFDNMYESILGNTVLWPAPGNHDYNNHIPFSPDPAYYDIFSLPVSGESGGIPSLTEKYYSYNIGNVHFISMDSYDESRSATAAMANWLQSDLAANTQPWVIAYWHHPPYTKGSHDSDDDFLNGELVEMRENIVPILENYGVDLILNGHSHSYERSKLVDGHYGYSSDLQPSMIVDAGSGNYDVECPYQKHTEQSNSHKGTVYSVVGCSGKLSGTSSGWPHPVMHESTNALLGSMLIEVDGNRLDAKFITADTLVHDQFTIMKNAGKSFNLEVCPDDTVFLHPSWNGNVTWFPGNSNDDSLEVIAQISTTYFAYDNFNCLTDTFEINILPSPPCASPVSVSETTKEVKYVAYPSSVGQGQLVTISSSVPFSTSTLIELYNSNGSLIKNTRDLAQANTYVFELNTSGLAPGIYLIHIQNAIQVSTLRIMIK